MTGQAVGCQGLVASPDVLPRQYATDRQDAAHTSNPTSPAPHRARMKFVGGFPPACPAVCRVRQLVAAHGRWLKIRPTRVLLSCASRVAHMAEGPTPGWPAAAATGHAVPLPTGHGQPGWPNVKPTHRSPPFSGCFSPTRVLRDNCQVQNNARRCGRMRGVRKHRPSALVGQCFRYRCRPNGRTLDRCLTFAGAPGYACPPPRQTSGLLFWASRCRDPTQ
jgi:hypothetical protein